MTLATGNSAQGTAFYDTEGITYVGQDGGKPQLVMTEERYRQLDEFDYTPGTTLTLADAQAVKLGTTIGNIGLEGVAYDPATSNASGCSSQTVGTVTGNFCQGFVVVKEKQPEDIFQTNVDWGSARCAEHRSGDGHGDQRRPERQRGIGRRADLSVPAVGREPERLLGHLRDVQHPVAGRHGLVTGADGNPTTATS